MAEEQTKRRRGPGKRPAMAHVTLRLPTEVWEFYRDGDIAYTALMRDVLTDYMRARQAPSPSDH